MVLSLGYSHSSPHWAHGTSTQLAQAGLIGQQIQPLPATYLQCQTRVESPHLLAYHTDPQRTPLGRDDGP